MVGDTDAAAGIGGAAGSAAAGADHGDVSLADREALVSYARQMAADDLAPGTSGNLSVRRGGLMAITPSGMPYERMTPADICLVRTSDAALTRSMSRCASSSFANSTNVASLSYA